MFKGVSDKTSVSHTWSDLIAIILGLSTSFHFAVKTIANEHATVIDLRV